LIHAVGKGVPKPRLRPDCLRTTDLTR